MPNLLRAMYVILLLNLMMGKHTSTFGLARHNKLIGLFYFYLALRSTNTLDLGPMLKKNLETSLDERIGSEMLQGTYWCEVWGVKPFVRHRSSSYLVKFSGKTFTG